jgi:uncharacterized membrane protein/protein-disulfide isomerase
MKFFTRKKEIIPLPYIYYYAPVFIINLIGLLDSIYLGISHYRNYADIGYHSFCAISRAINCDTVSQSPYSILFNIPVPIWGILGFLFGLVLILFSFSDAASKKRVWTLLLVTYATFCFCNIILAGISTFFIHSYCIMCILSYAACFLALYYIWIIRKRFRCEGIIEGIRLDIDYLKSFPKISLSIMSLFALVILFLFISLPRYWHISPPALSKDIHRGLTEDGHPWIGAEHPELVIIEFTDYMCFQCKKMHSHLRRLVQNYPDKIRLVHRNFPMDNKINPIVKQPFHIGAAKLSIISMFGAEKNMFWETNDILYQYARKGSIDINELAQKTGLDFGDLRHALRRKKMWQKLRTDISEGIKKYGLNGTPAYVINDQVYFGQIPTDILKKYVQ